MTTTVAPLLIDLYPRDHSVDWAAYIAAGPPWHGAIYKLTEGLTFDYCAWVHVQRTPLFESDRFGVDLFDGFFHYARFEDDGARQAEWFWRCCVQIGGERAGTLPAMLDIERGGQIVIPTISQLQHFVGAWAERYHTLSGRLPTLYGGELLRSLGVTDLMGCGRSAVALYGSRLGSAHVGDGSTAAFMRATGTDLEHTMLWQYRGTDAQSNGPPGYPMAAPGAAGPVDINAVILPGGLDALRALCV